MQNLKYGSYFHFSKQWGNLLKYDQKLQGVISYFPVYKYDYCKTMGQRPEMESLQYENTTHSRKSLLPSISSLFSPWPPSPFLHPDSPFIFLFCHLLYIQKIRYFRSDLQHQQQENLCDSSMTLGSGGSSVVGEFSTLEPCSISVWYLTQFFMPCYFEKFSSRSSDFCHLLVGFEF